MLAILDLAELHEQVRTFKAGVREAAAGSVEGENWEPDVVAAHGSERVPLCLREMQTGEELTDGGAKRAGVSTSSLERRRTPAQFVSTDAGTRLPADALCDRLLSQSETPAKAAEIGWKRSTRYRLMVARRWTETEAARIMGR